MLGIQTLIEATSGLSVKVGDLVKVRDGLGGFFMGIIIELDPNYRWVLLSGGEKYSRRDCRVVVE